MALSQHAAAFAAGALPTTSAAVAVPTTAVASEPLAEAASSKPGIAFYRTLRATAGAISAVKILSSAFEKAAVLESAPAGQPNDTVRIWDLDSGVVLAERNTLGKIQPKTLAPLADGSLLVSGDHGTHLLDPTTTTLDTHVVDAKAQFECITQLSAEAGGHVVCTDSSPNPLPVTTLRCARGKLQLLALRTFAPFDSDIYAPRKYQFLELDTHGDLLRTVAHSRLHGARAITYWSLGPHGLELDSNISSGDAFATDEHYVCYRATCTTSSTMWVTPNEKDTVERRYEGYFLSDVMPFADAGKLVCRADSKSSDGAQSGPQLGVIDLATGELGLIDIPFRFTHIVQTLETGRVLLRQAEEKSPETVYSVELTATSHMKQKAIYHAVHDVLGHTMLPIRELSALIADYGVGGIPDTLSVVRASSQLTDEQVTRCYATMFARRVIPAVVVIPKKAVKSEEGAAAAVTLSPGATG